jgi:lysophospholipase L1-like esterase
MLLFPRSPEARAAQSRRVVVLGNSILHGVGASSPNTAAAAVLAAGLEGRVDGVDAWVGSTSQLASALDTLLTDSPLDLVLVHTATRDVEEDPPAIAALHQRIVDRIGAAWHAPVLVLGPWGTDPSHPLDHALASALAGRAGYVSLAPIFAVEDLRVGGDDWHPNDRGHAAIAAALRSALDARGGLPPLPTPTVVPGPLVTPLAGWRRAHLPISWRGRS